MRAFGLNTVETYVAWNLHEPRPGEFHFEGMLDIVKFIETAADVGLKVIVRPGPYICSEWDFGGLPAWLLKDPDMQVRCVYPPFLAAVDRYFDALLSKLVPLQSTQGGPIIAMQVENEYGSYSNDKVYLRHLADGMRSRGIDSFLFISDGPVLIDRKGITDGVTINDQYQFGWEVFPLPLNDLSGLKFAAAQTGRFPAFFRAIFNVDEPADTFLALPGWTKGVVWLNGFDLGRYWERGAQKTLYVPAPLLKHGQNELIVFELHGTQRIIVEFRDAPELG